MTATAGDHNVRLRRMLATDPANASAWDQLGLRLDQTGSLVSAETALARCGALAPENGIAQINRASLLRRLGRSARGEILLRRALALLGAHVRAAESFAQILWEQGRTDEARQWYGRALATDDHDARARFGRCIAHLPVLYDNPADIEAARVGYARALDVLERWSQTASVAEIAPYADAVGVIQPFFLAYQGREDRALQAQYGRLVHRALTARHPEFAMGRQNDMRRPGGRVRIGLVSGFFRRHSVWKMALSGWIGGLDRSRFTIFGYHTSAVADDVTRYASSQLDGFVTENRRRTSLARRIAEDRLDAILYPEIGMDPVAAWLAALRLAPVQMMSWGHPTTSGYPSIDFFLSSDLMEPHEAERSYSERLVRLPGLGCLYRPTDVAPAQLTRADLGLSADDIVYLCAQSLYKYLPQDDEIFDRIGRAVPRARFVFFSGPMPAITSRFADRLARRLSAAGQNPHKRLLFLPALTEAGFLGVGRLADVLLDSVGWSGFNTTIEVIAEGIPVVTVSGSSLRGRHTSAVLTQLGHAEMVTTSLNDYVERAVRLGLDADFRRVIGSSIKRASPRLFGDAAPIRALEALLVETCRGGH